MPIEIRDRVVGFQKVPAGQLIANPKNWRKHPVAQRTALADLLGKIGFAGAGLVYTDTDGQLVLIDGHLRADMDPDFPMAVVVTDLTEAEANQLNAVYDPITMMAEADLVQLRANLEQMAADCEAGLVDGLDYLDEIMAAVGLQLEEVDTTPPKEDAGPLPQVPQRCYEGDLWKLGDHYLYCGSATSFEDVERSLQGASPAVCITDPPYNVDLGYDAATDDTKSQGDYAQFLRDFMMVALHYCPRIIVTPGGNNIRTWYRDVEPDLPMPIYHAAPWTKTNGVTHGKVTHFWCWEPILFFGEGWEKRRGNDVFEFPIGMQGGVGDHPCPKPLSLWTDLVLNFSNPGDAIFEPFSGSGTTLIACENTGRLFRGTEHSPHYCDIILARWESLTGKKAERVEL